MSEQLSLSDVFFSNIIYIDTNVIQLNYHHINRPDFTFFYLSLK